MKVKRGRKMAQLLTKSWSYSPSSPIVDAGELAGIADLLISSGSAGLAWRQLRDTGLRNSTSAEQFQQIYRYNLLQSALSERSLKQAVKLLRSFNIEPVLVKGWAIARLYPEQGLRPYCDHDLCVLPEQYAAAQAVLSRPEGQSCSVDLHCGFGKFYERQTEEIFTRSQLITIGGQTDDPLVRVLAAEDHLRFLCLHLLRHGVVRPLWLCDIGVALESRKADFDWDLCLNGEQRQADWVACAIGLAHQLVGVELDGTPVAARARNLPSWLLPAVLKEWGSPVYLRGQVTLYLRNIRRLWRDLLTDLPHHWPNPIEATTALSGPFNELPRLPFQLGHVAARATALLAQLSGLPNPTYRRWS